MTKLPYLRTKKAKGRLYYYFDAGKDSGGQRVLIKLPDIRDPGFGGSYARAKATRTNREKKKGTLTLDGLIRSYEKSPEFRKLSENSKLSYSRYLARAASLMRDKQGESWPARAIVRSDVLQLREALCETPGAANQTIRALQALFAWGLDNGKVTANPAEKVKKFAAIPHEPWPDELVEDALADPQVGDAVALLYFTGQRIDDVVAMTWAAIRGREFRGKPENSLVFQQKTAAAESGDHMLVWIKKKDKQIKVALLAELAERLNRIERPTLTILSNANGQPWSASGLRRKLQDWARERGHKIVPHGLRKNAVISLLEAGCTSAEVQGITDQSLQMIEHYAARVNKLHLGRAAVVKFDVARRGR